ncbi:MAG: redoxin family protein [Planctomycetes bacterium]|nr:redoxin family protein [Planctomycetota bacterium]NUQ34307.1 redoxin family protein [Planctomycetaceae bacterium]
MNKTLVISLALVALGGAGYFVIAEQKAQPVLTNIRLKTLDGVEVTLDGPDLAGKRAAICILSSWSGLCETQARQVIANAGGVDKLVFICQGEEREVREFRARLKAESHLWLKADGKVASDFASVFENITTLDRVPALIVIDGARKVLHASIGELSDAEVKAALSAKAE